MNDTEVINYIQKYFVYQKDGSFERKDRKNSKGSLDKDGYLIIKIKGKQYKAHRLVYAYHHGKFPAKEIDHINRVRTDNRIENLRECTRIENIKNSKKSGFGVYIDKTKGLKKKYTFKFKGKTYRYYSMNEAIQQKILMGGDINYECNISKIVKNTNKVKSA